MNSLLDRIEIHAYTTLNSVKYSSVYQVSTPSVVQKISEGMVVNTFHLKWIVLLPKIKILGAFCDLSANQLSQPDSIFWIRTGLAVLVNRQIINGSHYFSFFLDLSQFIWGENRWNLCPPYFFSYFWSYVICFLSFWDPCCYCYYRVFCIEMHRIKGLKGHLKLNFLL